MLLYLSSNGKSGLTGLLEGQELMVKKLVGKFSIKQFVAKDLRNYTGCKFFLLDVSCIEEQLDDFIVALRSIQIMLDVRIIPLLSGMENANAYIGRLVEIGVTDIVTAGSLDGIRDELDQCLSEKGMQRYVPAEESFVSHPEIDETAKPIEIMKYRWNCRNVTVAVAGTQRRSGVTVTAFNLAGLTAILPMSWIKTMISSSTTAVQSKNRLRYSRKRISGCSAGVSFPMRQRNICRY